MSKEKQQLKALTELIEGKLIAIASTEDKDRVGDVIKTEDWDLKNFKKNPVLQAGHDYRPQFTIGVAKNIRVENKKLIFEPVFHTITPLAREIKEMFEQEVLKAWSVGFIPAREEGEKHELLEVSAVAVPANASALILAKGMNQKATEELEGELNVWMKDATSDVNKKPVEEKKEEAEVETEETEEVVETEEIKETEGGEKEEVITKETKSPACRTEGESKADCVSRKISEILKENPDMEQDQAVAIANGICSEKCKSKESKSIERWNKQLPSVFNKAFDMEQAPSVASSHQYNMYSKYLGCPIKKVYLNSYFIPSPLLGTYLSAFKKILGDYKLIDERNFSYNGLERPLMYEVIQLTIDKTDDFLVEGVQFYETNSEKRFAVEFTPTWMGLEVRIVTNTTSKEWNKELLSDVMKEVKENHLLKGQIFALSGEFVTKTKDVWDDLVLSNKILEPIQKSIKQLKKGGKNAKSRGLMFVGYPGTGKTKTGKILMNDYEDAAFIWVSTKDFAKIGPLRAIKMAFSLARQISPAILFFEDVDKGILDSRVTDLLKTEMDGIQENKGMITILTSNNPEKFPDALLDRPGRFHEVLNFELPTKELRKDMLIKWAGEFEEKTLTEILEKTEGFSGAHMKELVDYALMIVEDDGIEISEALLKSLEKLSEQRELIRNLKKDVGDAEIDLKEGRTISSKNRKTITNAIEITKQATAALEALLGLNETPKDAPKEIKEGEVIGREPKVAQKSSKKVTKFTEDEIIVRALQKIAKNSNFALNRLKKQ